MQSGGSFCIQSESDSKENSSGFAVEQRIVAWDSSQASFLTFPSCAFSPGQAKGGSNGSRTRDKSASPCQHPLPEVQMGAATSATEPAWGNGTERLQLWETEGKQLWGA